jgi:ATP-dependent exoDNAse (exonuclease V) alpha subunit
MVPYEMLVMIDSRLKQLKNNLAMFGGLNVIVFGDLMQLPPVRGKQVFQQPTRMAPATHLWRLFTLVELRQNMRQQGDNTFIDILNALRIGEMRSEHLQVLVGKVSDERTGEFALERALRIYPTNDQVAEHNEAVLQYFRNLGTNIQQINAYDQLINSTANDRHLNLERITPDDINKTGGLPKRLEIFEGAKVMLRSNINVERGLVNGAIGNITEINWPLWRNRQVHERDIPSVMVDFGRDGVHKIEPKSIQFPAKYGKGTIERRMLPIVLSWASTVHKMQGSTVDSAVIYLGPRLFAEGQAYVALSRVRSLDGLQIEELDCTKLTGKKPCNAAALDEMTRMRNINETNDRRVDDQ